jgi:magnesium transporter
VIGLGHAEIIRRLGELFQLHSLALEDVVNVHQRPKIDPYGQQLYMVSRILRYTDQSEHLESEQISIFLGPKYLITFQERPGDCFDAVRDRIRKSVGNARGYGADYLAYALLDAIIDSYFPLLERFVDDLDHVEDLVIANPSPRVTEMLHHLRSELLLLRRSIGPHRECLNQLVRGDYPLITAETRLFLRDCYDHTFQLIELLEVYREICLDLRDYYVSMVSNRMNEIMKVLTVIATIFMPLSFVTSLYGMNFNPRVAGNMPELNLPYAYVGVLLLMSSIAVGMLLYFHRLGWIGSPRQAKRAQTANRWPAVDNEAQPPQGTGQSEQF